MHIQITKQSQFNCNLLWIERRRTTICAGRSVLCTLCRAAWCEATVQASAWRQNVKRVTSGYCSAAAHPASLS